MEDVFLKALVLIATFVVEMRPLIEECLVKIHEKTPRMSEWMRDVVTIRGEGKAKEAFRKAAIKFRIKSFTCPKYVIGKGGVIREGATSVDGTLLNYFIGIAEELMPDGSTYARATWDVIKVGFDKGLSNAARFVRDIIVVTNEDGVKNVYRVHNGKVYDKDGVKLEKNEAKQALSHMFRSFNLTPSQSNTTAGDRKKWQQPVIADQLDIALIKAVLTNAMSFLLVTKFAKGAIAKASTRLSQYMTPQADGGRVFCYAINLGKDLFADGQGYLVNTTAVRFLNRMTGGLFTTSKWNLLGLSLQGRPGSAKSMNLVVTAGYLLRLVKAAIKRSGAEPIVLVRSMVTAQDLAFFAAAYLGFGPWKDRVVVVAENREMARHWERHIEMYLDSNANKAPFDLGLPLYFSILEVTHAAHDPEHGAKLSIQVLQKAAWADFVATQKWAALAAKRELVERTAQWADESLEEYGLDTILDSRTVLEKVAVDCRSVLRPMFDSRIKGDLSAFVSSLGLNGGKITLKVPGEYRKSINDPAVEILGMEYKVLRVKNGTAEILAPGFAPGTKFLVFRFPSTGHRECLRCVVVDPKQYEARLHEMQVEAEAIKDIMDVVNHLSEGIIVLPTSKYVLSALGGADFDGDGFCMYQVAETSEHFENLDLEAIELIDDVEVLDMLIREAAYYFYTQIEPLCADVPEF